MKTKAQYNKEYYRKNRQRILEWQSVYYRKNKEKVLQASKLLRHKKKALLSEQNRRWRKANPDRVRKYERKYINSNPHRRAAKYARYRAALLRAMPEWADHRAIRDVYKFARDLTKQTGIRHDVDHIIPLRGKDVCGLHIAENLQAIPSSENFRKSNKCGDKTD